MLGLTILWAVVLGAFLKFVLNEGLARWQLATGDTLLQGCVDRFGKPVQWFFLGYLVIWSFLVGAMLMSAVGVTGLAIYAPLGSDVANKIFYGTLHSAVAVVLIRVGGYRLFQKVMSVCIALMFGVVVVTAVALRPPIGEVLTGLVWPMIPSLAEGVTWTVALIGGVGGTVTVLCYGYWIREEGRESVEDLQVCRIDLATGYGMTALFGLAMVVIGSSLGPVTGGGATLVVNIARELEMTLGAIGPAAKWAFLLGAWGAVFSSLLGVWQSVPYLFADFWSLTRKRGSRDQRQAIDTKALPYQAYLFGIALIPILGLVLLDFKTITKTYAVVGALFIPMLAGVLLVLNGRAEWVGEKYKNRFWTSLILAAALLFFLFAGFLSVRGKFFPAAPAAPKVSQSATLVRSNSCEFSYYN
jgi:Mn2+/Fe2+ NRAMP family transporter